EALSQRVEELASRPAPSAGGQALAEVSGRVGGVERNMAELGAAVSEIHRRLTALDGALGPIPGEIRGLGERLEGRIGSRLDQLDEIAAAVDKPASAQGTDVPDKQLAEIRAAVDSLVARPTLAEDRETIVLAVRQLLGDTVREPVAESEARLRAQTESSIRASEQRVLQHVDEAIYSLAEILVHRRRKPDAVAAGKQPAATTPQPAPPAAQPVAPPAPKPPAAPPPASAPATSAPSPAATRPATAPATA